VAEVASPERALARAKGLDAGALDPQQAAAAACCPCYSLRKASRAVSRIFDDALRPLGLKATQFSLVAAVHNASPITIKRLADSTVMDRTTLTRNLRPLERRGLIRIERGRDRRQRLVTLTSAGDDLLERAFPVWSQTRHQVTNALGPERSERLLDDLRAAVEVTWAG
jgi:DNA-binding MarR family transcriptional regulator